MGVNRRKFLKHSAAMGAVGVAGCTEGSSGDEDETDVEWTGRYLTEQRNLGWASYRNLSHERFSELFDEYNDRDYIIVDVGANVVGGDVRYTMAWRENVDDRGWAERRNMSGQQLDQRHDQYTGDGMRPLTLEGYDTGEMDYAGIWIENKEDLDWWADWDLTNSEFSDEFDRLKSDGYRPIDVETYQTDSGPRIAAVWWEDVEDTTWAHYRNMSREKYQQRTDDYFSDGYTTIDFESYIWNGERRYAAIWEKPDESYGVGVRTNRTTVPFSNWWRKYADMGLRLVDQEHYGNRYGGIWIENADRYRYSRKDQLDQEIKDYRKPSNQDVPGISAAIIQDGDVLYRRGFGWADEDDGREAHGETVYKIASVSKLFGGTLAARLESEGELQDGTSVDLDMTEPVSAYLTDPDVPGNSGANVEDIPDHHDYDVEELFAHLGCVPHYSSSTDPGTGNPTDHFDTATEAAAEFWDLDLVEDRNVDAPGDQSCSVGNDFSYSTFAFTIAGAVLEQVTGRRIARLVDEEITDPYGLDSTGVMFASDSLTPDPMRSMKGGSGDTSDYWNTSWKVLGGGIESTALDLAWFGWKTLDGQIVDDAVREDRLWSPVDDGCSSPGGGTCRYGVSWELDEYEIDGNDLFVAEHGGSSSGAGSHLAVIPDEGLVIALTSNMRGGNQNLDGLMDDLAEIVVG